VAPPGPHLRFLNHRATGSIIGAGPKLARSLSAAIQACHCKFSKSLFAISAMSRGQVFLMSITSPSADVKVCHTGQPQPHIADCKMVALVGPITRSQLGFARILFVWIRQAFMSVMGAQVLSQTAEAHATIGNATTAGAGSASYVASRSARLRPNCLPGSAAATYLCIAASCEGGVPTTLAPYCNAGTMARWATTCTRPPCRFAYSILPFLALTALARLPLEHLALVASLPKPFWMMPKFGAEATMSTPLQVHRAFILSWSHLLETIAFVFPFL
jgi:hypothetical protein